ncbi:MAG: twin-arginine translocation signal domain-containing protein [Verrucomicrobia bacterium]|nr:twin-arginine translocation signal domain-containing protein [Verrucomicrobiota bacterium]MDA1069014.1 twin-arginine translocation signal domain-containing protein [Verrucomicrobiota bacterium]
MNRRRFLQGLAVAGAASTIKLPSVLSAQDAGEVPKIKIVSVDAYPVRLWERTNQGVLPKFESDYDPRRWGYGGPFSQLAGAIMVVIKTDQGITGYGFGAGGSVAVEIIHGHLRHLLVGTNPLNVEMLWDQMYSSALPYGRRGVFVMGLSGVDNALWDILGKFTGQPVYRLLGGATKERIPIYQTVVNESAMDAALAMGVKHFKLPIRDGLFHGKEGMKRTVKLLEDARKVIGPDCSLMIDCSSRWNDVDYTIEMAKRLEEVKLYWIEEPLSPDNLEGYEQLVSRIESTKIASGEHEYTRFGFNELIRHKAADILQPDVSWCGGVTSLKKVAAMAAAHGLEFTPHRGGSLYGLPLCLSSTRCQWAESFGTNDSGTELMEAMTSPFKDGHYYPSEKPGFGTALTEAIVKKHALK